MSIDWTKITEKYKGQWVALKDDEVTVVANGKSLPDVLREAKEQGTAEPIVTKVPTEIVPYIS